MIQEKIMLLYRAAKTFFSGILCIVITFFPAVSRADGCSPFQLSLVTPIQLVPKDGSICGARLNLLYGSNREVWGLDAGVVNKAENLKGIELGLLVNLIKSIEETPSWGIQAAGLVNRDIKVPFSGIQVAGIANVNRDVTFTGIQTAILGNQNMDSEVTGMQVSLFNHSKKFNGIQVGLGNGVTVMEGAVALVVIPIYLLAAIVSGKSGGNPPLYAEREAHIDTVVKGVQFGVFTNITEELDGLQFGLFNYAGKTMNGIQIGATNMGLPDAQGFQLSLWNFAGNLTGLQLGGVNIAKDVNGFQIGFVNDCTNLKGVQIGAINIVTSRFPNSLFFAPIINAGF